METDRRMSMVLIPPLASSVQNVSPPTEAQAAVGSAAGISLPRARTAPTMYVRNPGDVRDTNHKKEQKCCLQPSTRSRATEHRTR